MSVALFVPCYVDQLRPRIGLAALDLLRAAGHAVEFLDQAVCCGQPCLTAGEDGLAAALGRRVGELAAGFDTIVMPSGSCAATLRNHLPRWSPASAGTAERVMELTDFLEVDGRLPPPRNGFAHRVGLHASCHALRELRQGTPSETREPPREDPAAALLRRIPGLTLVDLTRRDECCGFGGVFSIEEQAVSSRMGRDRLADHRRGGADLIASTDVSCLLHLEGLARHDALGAVPPPVLHVAEILAEAHLGAGWLDRHADETSVPLPSTLGVRDGAR